MQGFVCSIIIYILFIYTKLTTSFTPTHTVAQPMNDNGWSGGRWHGIHLDMSHLG
jgi:hypothetical protein